MKFTVPRGTKDILPDEMEFWHHVENTSRALFELYNYREIRTPIFESTELFQMGVGDGTDIVEKEMYSFKDKSDRNLTLRPEGTAPIVRAYIQNGFHAKEKVTKVYYCGPMFRYERPQAGRYRQFHQIGVECLGNAHPFSDAEVISLGLHLFDEMGMSGLSVSVNSVGCQVCRPVINERLKQFLGANLDKMCVDCQRRFASNPLRILDCKNEKCQPYLSGIPSISDSLCQECRDHFTSVVEYLGSLGIPFTLNSRLVRGLDYYTRTTFEIVSDQLGAQNAICGGGRYDLLVEKMGGPSTPAVGFAFGVERAVMVLKEFSDILKKKEKMVFVAPIGTAQEPKCFFMTNELRRAGIKCEMNFSKNNLKSQLQEANKMKADFTLIFGDQEAEKGVVLVKRMSDGKQTEVAPDNIVSHIQSESKL